MFDACILCGDQGYVMEGEQVICIVGGVRISFRFSIGKAGGCNPVPTRLQQTESEIVIYQNPRSRFKLFLNHC